MRFNETALDNLAQTESDKLSAADPGGANGWTYLIMNELEMYLPYHQRTPEPEIGFKYYTDKLRALDAGKGISRTVNSHHIEYVWQQSYESLPWLMDTYTLGNYGGGEWVRKLRETAQRSGFNNAHETYAWYPSNEIEGTAEERNAHSHLGLPPNAAPITLDPIADIKDNTWTAFEEGAGGVSYYIWDGVGAESEEVFNWVDADGNDIKDRRWAAYADMAKQIRAAEGRPFVELTSPRRLEVVEQGSVTVKANAVPSDAAVQSVVFEYNDGTNDTWTPIGTDNSSPYQATWDTSAFSTGNKYFVRARAFDGMDYSDYAVSDLITLVAAGGPAVTNVAAVNPVYTNGILTSLGLTATATDSGQHIAAVEYYVDTVQQAGHGMAMSASDGTFNNTSEGAAATIAVPSYADTTPILIDDMEEVDDWTASGGANIAISATAAHYPAGDVLNIAVSNDNDNNVSNNLRATKSYGSPIDLTHLDTLGFWIRSDTALSHFQVRMIDADGTSNDASIATFLGTSTLGADEWHYVRWNFRENPGMVSGGSPALSTTRR